MGLCFGGLLPKLTTADIQKLGLPIFEVVTTVNTHIARDREWFAKHPLKIKHVDKGKDCDRIKHRDCSQAWQKFWWEVIAPKMICPDVSFISFQFKTVQALKNAETPTGMTPGCFHAVKEFVSNHDKLRFKFRHVEYGVKELERRMKAGEID